jgi:hypothetical protein
MSVDLTGAADLHCHFGPDPHRERSVDAFEAASEAAAAGHRAIVLKSHDSPTASLAWAVQRTVGDSISVFGGICCDREVGGVNPAAVEVALGLGARIVWLPTLSSRQDFDNGVAAQLGIPGPGIVVTDADDRLLPETREVLALVKEHDAILATGHVSAAEHYAVVKEFARDAKVLVTHATEDLAGPKLTAGQCRELADLGAWIELCAMTCIGGLATRTVAEMVETIGAVGVGHVTLGTDFGQKINPHPAAGLQTYADGLYAQGVSADDIRRMACANPRELLGVE